MSIDCSAHLQSELNFSSTVFLFQSSLLVGITESELNRLMPCETKYIVSKYLELF